MRFTQFMCRLVGDTVALTLAWQPEDFKAVGLPFARMGGMPALEAYQLINRWNANKSATHVYWLE